MNYDVDYIHLLSDLAVIHPSILIKRDGETNVVKHNTLAQSIFYELTAPKDMMEFEQDYIAFATFSEFYNIFKSIKTPEISMPTERQIMVSEDKSKIRYGLTDESVIRGRYSSTEIPSFDASVDITSDSLQLIRSRIGLVNAQIINFTSSNGFLFLRAFNTKDKSTDWRHEFAEADKPEVNKEAELNVNFPVEIFTKAPKGSYRLSISEMGLLCMEFVSDRFGLKIYAVGADITE